MQLSRRDPVRPVPKLKLEIEAHATGGIIPGWYHCLKQGTSVVEIYEDDLAKVQAMVETRPELWEQAERMYCAARDSWVAANAGPVPVANTTQAEKNDYESRCVSLSRQFAETTIVGEFHRLILAEEGKERGRRPIKSFRVLEQLAPPETDSEKMVRNMVASLANQIGSSRSAEASAEIAELRAQVAALTALVKGSTKAGK